MQPRGIQVAPLIRAARRSASLSINQLAEELGVGRTTVVSLETGRRSATGVEVATIARVIEASVAPLEERLRRARFDNRLVSSSVSWLVRARGARAHERQRSRLEMGHD